MLIIFHCYSYHHSCLVCYYYFFLPLWLSSFLFGGCSQGRKRNVPKETWGNHHVYYFQDMFKQSVKVCKKRVHSWSLESSFSVSDALVNIKAQNYMIDGE